MSEIEDIFESAIPTITRVIPETTITERKRPTCFIVSRELYLKLMASAQQIDNYKPNPIYRTATRLEYNGIPVYSEDEVVIIK